MRYAASTMATVLTKEAGAVSKYPNKAGAIPVLTADTLLVLF